MSESLGIDNPPKKVTIEGAKRPNVPKFKIYNNLLDKVAGIKSKVQESPNIRSNRMLEKRLRGLGHRCMTILQSVEEYKPTYAARLGTDAVQSAEKDLEQLSIQIQAIGSQRAEEASAKRTEELRKMGYGG